MKKILVIFAILALSLGAYAQNIKDFSFLHDSDIHSPAAPVSFNTIKQMENADGFVLTPYNVLALKPEFVIETGDVTEFGDIGNAWSLIEDAYKNTGLVRYTAPGNHDYTWNPINSRLDKINYSFDKNGVHFVCLNSAGILDPRPAFAAEAVNFLKDDLKKIKKTTPLIVAFHHPFGGGEWSSEYNYNQIKDLLYDYNIIALLVGHGHTAYATDFDGINMIQGGSTFGGEPGYMVDTFNNNVYRVAYRIIGQGVSYKPIYERDLKIPVSKPTINFLSPKLGQTLKGDVEVVVKVKGLTDIKDAYLELNGNNVGKLANNKDSYKISIPKSDFSISGGYYIKAYFVDSNKKVYNRSTSFYVELDNKLKWRRNIGTASKTMPVEYGNKVFVAGTNGYVYGLNKNSGNVIWKYNTGGTITGTTLLVKDDKIYVANSNGFVYSLSLSGKLLWKFKDSYPIFTGISSNGNSLVYAGYQGNMSCLSIDGSKLIWSRKVADGGIEATPLIYDNKIFVGAWDNYLYAINMADGELVWKSMGAGSEEREAAKRYYSPADSSPVALNDKIYVADRDYKLSVMDIKDGKKLSVFQNAISACLYKDYVYVRYSKKLGKLNTSGGLEWQLELPLGYVPIVSTADDSAVYMLSDSGLLSVVSLDGKLLWQYRTTPSLYVWASAGVGEKQIYVIGTDGVVTSLNK